MIFQLFDSGIRFPDPRLAESDGLLAIGGSLSVKRLVAAYHLGIFPWFSDESPILWYSPHQRFVLYPEKVKISKSMRQILRTGSFTITRNTAFKEVIKACAKINRNGQDGTWITGTMQRAYVRMHKRGLAHSVEVWQEGKLVGGLYGVEVNAVFCGESMFSTVSNASKAALIWLCQHGNYKLIDCQTHTVHLESMGSEFISREEFMKVLNQQITD